MNTLILVVFMLSTTGVGIAQDRDEGARDIFLGSRREYIAQPGRAEPLKKGAVISRKRIGSSTKLRNKRREQITGSRKNESSGSGSPNAVVPEDDDLITSVAGLGYTVFLRERSGSFVRVSPSRTFHTGESIRILVESSIDGYLYLFHQADDGLIKMLFPVWEARSGDNKIWAHYPQIMPDPNLYEFVFKGTPATEKLTIIVSRSPITGVPIREDLKGLQTVPITLEFFRQFSRDATLREYHKIEEGVVMTKREEGRDIQMIKSDPSPAHILLNHLASGHRVIARLVFEHR